MFLAAGFSRWIKDKNLTAPQEGLGKDWAVGVEQQRCIESILQFRIYIQPCILYFTYFCIIQH